ncbi:MAG: ABC-type branched-chain amino acid transport system, substrate-binding protein, partial [Ilumatobacteraceae bacterium]|nr:ABC-type branched-chain amino acid transport system, substrate-binding protein [Ilumatobacteraceae bacterium]
NSLTSKLSFPTFPVIPTVMAFAAGAKLEGAKTAQLVTIEGPSSQFNIDITNKQLTKFGIETKGVVSVPASATDLTVYAGQLVSGGADAILFELGQDMTENLLKSLQQQGLDFTKTQVWNGGAIVTQKFVDDFDGSLEGVYTAGPFWPATDPTNAGIAKMLKELTDSGLPTTGISDWETTSWSTIHVLNQVLQGLTTIDSPSLVDALNKLVVTQAEYPETGGYDFTKPAIPDDPVLGTMRIFNVKMYIAKIVDGTITPQYPDFIDPLADI